MADAPSDNIHMMLGEMRGQLREAIHTVNNTAGKIDALTREVIEVRGIAQTVAAIEVRVTLAEGKIETLETTESRRQGALSLGGGADQADAVGAVVGAVADGLRGIAEGVRGRRVSVELAI